MIINVYSLVIYGDKVIFWNSFSQPLQMGYNTHYVLRGDFNMTFNKLKVGVEVNFEIHSKPFRVVTLGQIRDQGSTIEQLAWIDS